MFWGNRAWLKIWVLSIVRESVYLKKKNSKKKRWIYGKRESKKWGCEQQESSFFADDVEKWYSSKNNGIAGYF